MKPLDPSTIILLTVLICAVMSLVVFSLKRSFPPSIHGLGHWAVSLLSFSVAAVLAVTRGTVPEPLSVSLPNLLIAGGFYVGYVGSQRFFGVPSRLGPWLVWLLGLWLVLVWFAHVQPNYPARLGIFNLQAAPILACHAALIYRNRPFTLAKSLGFGVMAFMTALQVLRGVGIALWPEGESVLHPSALQVLYVTGLSLSVLLFSISVVLMATDQLRTKLEHLASHDSLTGARTRRSFDLACQQEFDRCQRSGRSMALLLMDLDHFKAINDNHGHHMGDIVLTQFVAKVNAQLRSPDCLGRFGGEEFVVLLPETALEEATLVAQRIRQACDKLEDGPSCTVSIGVATLAGASDTVQAMMVRADAAMYRAKAMGRNRVEVG